MQVKRGVSRAKPSARGRPLAASGLPAGAGGAWAQGPNDRVLVIDGLRGAAMVWMACFHFCFDLANFHLIETDFYANPLWTLQRTCILSTFLMCAGAGQELALACGLTWRRFWKRWAQIAACSLLVSAGSWVMFPNSFIYFGVLHGMAVMLVLTRLLAGFLAWRLPLGAVCVALPWFYGHPWFDSRWTSWIGLVTHKPMTEDFVPLLPWLGVMLWGGELTRLGLGWRARLAVPGGRWASTARPWPATLVGGALARGLVALGRISLRFYMLHQPVLIAAVLAWMWLTGRALPV